MMKNTNNIKPLKLLAKLLPIAVLGLSLAACDKNDLASDVIDPTEPADKIYNQALANLEVGNFTEAIKKFEKVDRQHPYSPLARKASIMTTYLAFQTKDYEQAIENGERFVSLYPSDEEAPYALYLVGLANFEQLRDITRDQDPSRKTIRAMNEIITRYPDSEYVEDAQIKLIIARDQLAAQEMLVGRYYQERREFIAAINRFRTVLDEYETTRHVEEALARLIECYRSLGLEQQAQQAAVILAHNYGDSQWYKDSYNLLQQSQFASASQNDSFFSRLFARLRGKDISQPNLAWQ